MEPGLQSNQKNQEHQRVHSDLVAPKSTILQRETYGAEIRWAPHGIALEVLTALGVSNDNIVETFLSILLYVRSFQKYLPPFHA